MMEITQKNIMRRALVCGGTQGIGKACAVLLAQNGFAITLLARNAIQLVAVQAELCAHNSHQTHHTIAADVSNITDLQQKIQAYTAQNRIDVVINNTGGPPAGALAQATIQDLTQALNNHLFASHAILQAVLPAMQAQQWGRIINIISTSVKAPLHNLGVSNTTRAAVANWSKTLANELGKYNITVNNVLPGATDTGRLQAIIQHKASAQHTDIQHITQQMQNEIPLQRFAQPEEIAAAVGFLASDAAAYITGINLPVDGGRTPNL